MSDHEAVLRMAADHPAVAGHFPGNPIMPGAVVLQAVVRAIGATRPGQRCVGVSSAKFLAPVRPGDTLDLRWDDAGCEARFTASAGTVRALAGVARFGCT